MDTLLCSTIHFNTLPKDDLLPSKVSLQEAWVGANPTATSTSFAGHKKIKIGIARLHYLMRERGFYSKLIITVRNYITAPLHYRYRANCCHNFFWRYSILLHYPPITGKKILIRFDSAEENLIKIFLLWPHYTRKLTNFDYIFIPFDAI